MTAYCGITCTECPAYIAKQTNDDKLRAKTAEEWSKMYNADLKAEQINCDGCKSTSGVLFSHCQVCNIRACGVEKQVEHCGACTDFKCEKISEFYKMAPELADVFTK